MTDVAEILLCATPPARLHNSKGWRARLPPLINEVVDAINLASLRVIKAAGG